MLCESVSSVLIVFYNKYMESMLGLSRRLEFHILKLISTYAFFVRIVILVSSLFFRSYIRNRPHIILSNPGAPCFL